jgi:hypothetical protein
MAEKNPYSQFNFSGRWLPDLDPALIGAENFRTLKNMRYVDDGIEGIAGYTKINSISGLPQIYVQTGIQLRTGRAIDPILVHLNDLTGAGAVYVFQDEVPNTGYAGPGNSDTVNGEVWHPEATCTCRWWPFDSTFGWTATASSTLSSESDSDYTYCLKATVTAADKGGYFDFTSPASGAHRLRFRLKKGTQNVRLRLYRKSGIPAFEYDSGWVSVTDWTLFDVSPSMPASAAMRCTIEVAATGTGFVTQLELYTAEPIHDDASTNLGGRLALASPGSVVYCNGEETKIWSGRERRVGAFFTVDSSSLDNPQDHTEKVNNALSDANNRVSIGTQKHWVIFTSRPLGGVLIKLQTVNDTASTLTVKYYDSDGNWTTVRNYEDGTSDGTISLAHSGWVKFTGPETDAQPYPYRNLLLYAYHFELSAGTAKIYQVSADAPFQDIHDIWDGVYRQCIEAQFYNASKYEDYTLHIQESSTIDFPVGMILDGLVYTTDHVLFMLEERTTALRVTMLAGLVNTNASTLTIKYWDGDSFAAVTNLTDGTSEGGTKTFGKSGLISWDPPGITSEAPYDFNGTIGYAYKLEFSATLSGTKAGAEEIVADIVYGLPTQPQLPVFKFSGRFKNRLMLLNNEQGFEENRADYSMTDAPEVLNGEESSMNGLQSLYFGGREALTCSSEIYNRFGSRIYTLYLVFKNYETYILDGDGPEDYRIYPVSYNIGCPCPETLDTAEIGFNMAEDVQRNVALWISASGPMIFDGALIKPIKGIDSYFDPDSATCVNFAALDKNQAKFDPVKKEWNVLLCTGSSTIPDVWLVWDVRRDRWYEKNIHASAPFLRSLIKVKDSDGLTYMYGGTNTGYLMRLDNGTDWDGYDIEFEITSGDWWPSGSIWEEDILKRYKLIAKDMSSENPAITIKHSSDTEAFSSLATFYFNDSNKRIIRLTKDFLDKKAWCHAIQITGATNSTTKGFQPIGWGVEWYMKNRDTAEDTGTA